MRQTAIGKFYRLKRKAPLLRAPRKKPAAIKLLPYSFTVRAHRWFLLLSDRSAIRQSRWRERVACSRLAESGFQSVHIACGLEGGGSPVGRRGKNLPKGFPRIGRKAFTVTPLRIIIFLRMQPNAPCSARPLCPAAGWRLLLCWFALLS